MSFQYNTNLPLSYVKPVVAVQIDANAPAVANADEASTVLLIGEQLTSGIAPFNSVQPLNSQQDANNNYGKKSTVARMMRAALSQPGVTGAVKFYGLGVAAPSGGTAAIGQIVCSVVTADGSSGTNPLAAGGVTFFMGGTELASLSWTTSDTATTIGELLEAQLNLLEYSPWGTWTNSTGTLTATGNIKGALLEDYPIRVVYSKPPSQCGVFFGPGSLTLTNNAATADGSIVITTGATTITTAIVSGDTPTQMGDKLVAQFLTNDYPLLAGKNNSGVVPFYYSPGADVRRPSCYIITSTGTTAQFTGGSATSGAGSPSSITYANTPGAGYPTLTTAVANMRNSGSFGKIVCPWASSSPLGTIFAAIVTDGDGGPTHQKGQTLTTCVTDTESSAETLIGATSPAMTATTDNAGLRGVCLSCPDAAQPGYELSARVASKRAASAAFTNYDGVVIAGTSDVPCLLPAQSIQVAFDDSTQNTAIRAGLTPLAVKDGSLTIVFGRTTMSTTAAELWDWCWIDQADNHRLDIRAQANATFKGCALISPGTIPRSRNDVDPKAIISFLQNMLIRWEAQGTYDGAQALKGQCDAQINPSQRSRADAVYPESPKTPLHTIGLVAQRQSPPTT